MWKKRKRKRKRKKSLEIIILGPGILSSYETEIIFANDTKGLAMATPMLDVTSSLRLFWRLVGASLTASMAS
jgi:hypothetical protein